jgi:uncharacterized protein YjiS (DUF1127 family)
MALNIFAPATIGGAPVEAGRRLTDMLNRAYRFWQARRATRKLEGLDDRMLGDIGISRADIDRVVRHGRPPARFY